MFLKTKLTTDDSLTSAELINLWTYTDKKYILTSVFVLSQNKVTQEKYIKHFLIKTI